MQPLLFVHGACSTGAIWVRQRRTFLNGEFPTLPDLAVADHHLIAAWADWLAQSYPGPHIVVAHSMGGAVALSLARQHPEAVAGLVLVGTGPDLTVSPDLLYQLHHSPEEALGLIAEWSLSPTAPTSLRNSSKLQIQRVSPLRAQQEFRAANAFSARSWLQEVVPALAIVTGGDDLMTPPALAREFLQAWPDVPYYELEHAGHLVMMEQPDRFNAVLSSILSSYGK